MPNAQHRDRTSRCSIKASLVLRKQAVLCSTLLCPTYILIMPFIKHLLYTRDHIQEALQVDSARVQSHGPTNLASTGFSGLAAIPEWHLPRHPPSRARRSCSGLAAEAVL